jgi:hypothetical protein
MFAPTDAINERLNTCSKCKYFKKSTRTCGTPIKGDTIKYKKQEYKLCGCFMDVKARLRYARCPLNKWADAFALTDLEYKKLKELLGKTVDKVTREQNQLIATLHKKYLKSNAKPSSCPPCVSKYLIDLQQIIEQYEK